MSDLSVPVLLLIFVAAAVATWIAGVRLAKATDVIDDHFGLGQAIGGMILLSIVGSLPGLIMTADFVAGIILRPSRRHAGLGADSWVVILVYALGLWGFVVIS